MLGPETIRNISDVAAYRAAEEDRKPLPIWRGSEESDCRSIPFLGEYCPGGYRPATWSDLTDPKWAIETLPTEQRDRLLGRFHYRRDEDPVEFMVDSSGWGSPGEPALTFEEFCEVAGGGYWAIVESGQFQIVARLYVKDAYAEGTPGPSYEDVMCRHCETIHSDLEECDGPYCVDCGAEEVENIGDLCAECDDEPEQPYEWCHACDRGIAEGDANVIAEFAESVMYRDEGESGILCDRCYEKFGTSIDRAPYEQEGLGL